MSSFSTTNPIKETEVNSVSELTSLLKNIVAQNNFRFRNQEIVDSLITAYEKCILEKLQNETEDHQEQELVEAIRDFALWISPTDPDVTTFQGQVLMTSERFIVDFLINKIAMRTSSATSAYSFCKILTRVTYQNIKAYVMFLTAKSKSKDETTTSTTTSKNNNNSNSQHPFILQILLRFFDFAGASQANVVALCKTFCNLNSDDLPPKFAGTFLSKELADRLHDVLDLPNGVIDAESVEWIWGAVYNILKRTLGVTFSHDSTADDTIRSMMTSKSNNPFCTSKMAKQLISKGFSIGGKNSKAIFWLSCCIYYMEERATLCYPTNVSPSDFFANEETAFALIKARGYVDKEDRDCRSQLERAIKSVCGRDAKTLQYFIDAVFVVNNANFNNYSSSSASSSIVPIYSHSLAQLPVSLLHVDSWVKLRSFVTEQHEGTSFRRAFQQLLDCNSVDCYVGFILLIEKLEDLFRAVDDDNDLEEAKSGLFAMIQQMDAVPAYCFQTMFMIPPQLLHFAFMTVLPKMFFNSLEIKINNNNGEEIATVDVGVAFLKLVVKIISNRTRFVLISGNEQELCSTSVAKTMMETLVEGMRKVPDLNSEESQEQEKKQLLVWHLNDLFGTCSSLLQLGPLNSFANFWTEDIAEIWIEMFDLAKEKSVEVFVLPAMTKMFDKIFVFPSTPCPRELRELFYRVPKLQKLIARH
jgi:hypothetical protein